MMVIIKEIVRSVDNDMEKFPFSFIASKTIKWHSYFGNILAVPQNVKQLPFDSAFPF